MWPLIGALGSGIVSAWGAMKQQQASQRMAREQMQFQERMSSTAHQREVADLQAAGLNPMFSLGQPGASTPSGAMGEATNPVGDALASAQSFRRTQQELSQSRQSMDVQRTQSDMDVKVKASQVALNAANAASARAGIPMKAGVGSVANDARELYEWMKRQVGAGVDHMRKKSQDFRYQESGQLFRKVGNTLRRNAAKPHFRPGEGPYVPKRSDPIFRYQR